MLYLKHQAAASAFGATPPPPRAHPKGVADCNITPLRGSRSDIVPLWDIILLWDASCAVYNNYVFGSAGGTRLISNANMAAVAQAGKKPKVNNPY